MRFFDYISTSIKNLTRQKLRTFLTVSAITIGSLSVILMLSILISVRQSLQDSFAKMGAFNLVTVIQDPNSVDNTNLISSGNGSGDNSLKKIDDTTVSAVLAMNHVVSATPTVSTQFKTMKLEGADKKTWASLMAYQPSSKVFDLPLLAGRQLNDDDLGKVVVGSGFLNMYGASKNPAGLLGKNLVLTRDGGDYPDWGDLPPKPPVNADKSWWDAQQGKDLAITAEIVGVADNSTMDDKANYISLAWAGHLNTSVRWENDDSAMKQCQEQQKSGNSNISCPSPVLKLTKDNSNATKYGYGSVIAKVDDQNNAKSVGDQITKLGFGAVTAENMIKQINQIFLMIGVVLGAIGGISLFVAAIGIINTMVMATFERTREIGVMRACGATRAIIRRLFTFEAATLGFLGGLLGLVISIALINIAKWAVLKYGSGLGNIPIDKVGEFPWWLIFSVVGFTTLVGLLSGLGPAIRAARLNPVDALRYE